jgi:hypothetical protein
MNDKFSELEAEPEWEKDYFLQKGRSIKRLVEEVRPLAALGLHLFRPGVEVNVQCFMGNQPYDGEIEISGFNTAKFKIEVVSDETPKSVFRRQNLGNEGWAYSTFDIEKVEGKDTQIPKMVDSEEQDEEWVNTALDRVKHKINKGYGPDTAILVRLDMWRPMSLLNRNNLLRMTKRYLIEEKTDVYSVFFCDVNRFIVDEVKLRK